MGTKLFGIDIASVANKAISPGLLPITITHYSIGERSATNPTAGSAPRPTTHSAKGVRIEYKDSQIDDKTILRGDRKVLVMAASISPAVVPLPSDLITIEGETSRIVEDGVKSDPATATYTCQVRAF